MSERYKATGKGVSLCQVIALLMTCNRTRGDIAAALKADPDSVGHSLNLLGSQGLAYRSHVATNREPMANGNFQRGPYPIVWAWNTTPHQYTDFRGPASNQKGE